MICSVKKAPCINKTHGFRASLLSSRRSLLIFGFFFFFPHEKLYFFFFHMKNRSSLLHFGFGPQMLISLVFLQKVCLRSRLWKVDGRGLFHVLQKVLGNFMQIYFLSLALFCYLHYLCVCVCCVCVYVYVSSIFKNFFFNWRIPC